MTQLSSCSKCTRHQLTQPPPLNNLSKNFVTIIVSLLTVYIPYVSDYKCSMVQVYWFAIIIFVSIQHSMRLKKQIIICAV